MSEPSPPFLPSAAPDVAHPRAIKSYVLRAGRTTSGQARAFAQFGGQWLLPYQAQPLDVANAFGAERAGAPLILEIGFGMGEATAHIARVRPQDNFLCCEVHEPGVGALLKRAGEQGLHNIRIVQHDAVQVLTHMLPAWSAQQPAVGLAGVHIFFPDPWHKKRHHKRRLIQPPLVALLASRLRPGGYIHCATDWQPYAQQMLAVLCAEPLLRNRVATAAASAPLTRDEPASPLHCLPVQATGYAPRPDYRPLTKFENRGLRLGHGVWDLVFDRV